MFEKPLNFKDIIDIKKIGIRFIEEISGYNEISDNVYKYMSKNNMGINSVHYNFMNYDISDVEENKRFESIKSIKLNIDRVNNINGKFVIVHPIALEKPGAGLIGKKEKNLKIKICVNSLLEIVKYAYLKDVIILIENGFSCYDWLNLGDDIEEFNFILKRIRSLSGYNANIGLCLDTGHAFITNNLFDYLDFFREDIKEVHLHDNYGSQNPNKLVGNEDCHLPPGLGKINWKIFFNKLESFNLEPLLVFEIGPECLKIKNNKTILIEIEKFLKGKEFSILEKY